MKNLITAALIAMAAAPALADGVITFTQYHRDGYGALGSDFEIVKDHNVTCEGLYSGGVILGHSMSPLRTYEDGTYIWQVNQDGGYFSIKCQSLDKLITN